MTAGLTILNDLSCSERLAVWTLRRLAGPPHPAGGQRTGRAPAGLFMPCFRRDFDDVTAAFRTALNRLAVLKMQALDLGLPAAQTLSTTESRFLDAISAAQAGEDARVRGMLRRVIPHRHVLAPFAAAVTLLGACLAGAGHWLPRRTPADDISAEDLAENGPPALARRREGDPGERNRGGRIQDCGTDGRRTVDLIGPGCLTAMARWHDLDMGMTQIMWPRPEDMGAAR
ncbi:hypothetical protein [Gluconacetobacter diazotrophicus]|uniref:hypothetical protein n=1 Tax=Gluconacetobacter diazotrophicus TaxID=33996 RepID=UPI00030C021C|nr:hypothetical protein [Gluconacetobacter diazotrophicus]